MAKKGDGKKRKLAEEANGAALQLSTDQLHSLLEPLSKEQLISLLVNAGSSYPAIAEEIKDVASKDPAHRKLFVRGLAWETSSQTLCDAFEQYGEIEEGAVIMDKASGKSRRFGFVTFKHMDSAQRALMEPSKTIDGRITISNLAVASTGPGLSADQAQRKLYIGVLSDDTANDKLLEVFSEYGEIEEGSVVYDKSTNKSRGFAFVTFKTVEATKRALKEPNKTIDGRTVTVKLAADGQRADQAQRKLYIGGLSYDTANDKLLEVFSKYGEIEEGSVAYDKNTNKSRGFAFVTFKTVEATRRALKEPNKTIDGRTVIVKLADDGQKEKPSSQHAISPQMQPVPQIQIAYGTEYPSLTSYHRPVPQGPASALPPIGSSAYPSGLTAYASKPSYATQPSYGISSASQYGALSSTTPYSSNQYGKYATSLEDIRLVQSGLHRAGAGAGASAGYPYYGTGASGGYPY